MSITKKLLGVLVLHIFPAIFSVIFTIWITNMPNYFDLIYQCPAGDTLCFSIIGGVVFILGYVVIAIVIGIIWDGLKLIFPKIFKSSTSPKADLFGVNSLWSIIRNRSELKFDIKKEGYEVFIDVKNRSWFNDILKLRLMYGFLDEKKNGELVTYTFDWLQGSNRSGEVFIGKRKTKTIHFATINQLQRTYDMHFLENDLNNPFENDRLIIINVAGLTSVGAKKYLKKDLNGSLMLLTSVSKGILNFEIANYDKMGTE